MKNNSRSTQKSLARVLGAFAAAPIFFAGAAFAASPSVYGEGPMVKVLPTDMPQADTGVGLAGARNEFVSFQVVVNGGDSGAQAVSAKLDALTGPAQISGSDIKLYRETYLTTTTPSTPSTSTGTFPDGLQPDVDEIAGETRWAFPFDVPAGESRVIWIDVHIPANAAAGKYTGNVVVSGGASASVPVTLTVVDASLPSTPSLNTAYRISSLNVCAAHTGDQNCNGDTELEFKLLGEYEQMALEHRITLSNIIPRVPQDGDWSNTDRWVGGYMDGTAPSRLSGAKMTSAEFMGQGASSDYAAFASHFQSKGWLDRAYAYAGDEPPYGISFADAATNEATVKSGAPNLRTLVTTTVTDASTNGLLSNLDLIVPVVNDIDGDAAPYDGDQSAQYASFLNGGHALWLYQSCMSHGCAYGTNSAGATSEAWPSVMVDASSAQNRAMQWVDFLEGASGELYYETAQALPSAWSDQFQFNGNGDGTLFYPGTSNVIGGSTDVPVASIRLKLIRLGVQDFEWLKMVSDAGDAQFAREVARALVPNAHQVIADGTAFERARLQLIARYLQLTGKSPATAAPGAPPSSPSQPPQSVVASGSDPSTGAMPPQGNLTAPGAEKVHGGCASGEGAMSLLAGAAALFLMRRRRVAK